MSDAAERSIAADRRFAVLLAVPLFVFELAILTHWGWFRDELYYMASTWHLHWGYIDHPPLSIALLTLVRVVAGPSLVAMRIVAALLGAGTVTVVALLARRIGGGRWAMVLAASVTTCSVALFLFHYYSMNALDLLLWPAILLAACDALERPDSRRWSRVGILLGLGLLNKLSVVWLGTGLLLALLVTPYRGVLRRQGPWLAAAIALGLFLPYLVWQMAHHWPTAEFVANARAHKITPMAPPEFWANQLQMFGPVGLLLAVGGSLLAVVRRRDRTVGVVGIVFVAVAAYLTTDSHAKPYYLATALIVGAAAGAAVLDGLLNGRSRWLRHGLPALLLALQVGFGIEMAPAAAPVLSREATVAHLEHLGIELSSGERGGVGRLPQHLADMNGWAQLAADVAAVHDALPAADRDSVTIYATNYGRAGAVDVLGRELGLPACICSHNSYWLWAIGREATPVFILVGGDLEDYVGLFETVDLARVHTDPWAVPGEAQVNIFVARGMKQPMPEVWAQARDFI